MLWEENVPGQDWESAVTIGLVVMRWAAVQKQGEVPPAAAEAPEARLLPPDHKLPCPFL